MFDKRRSSELRTLFFSGDHDFRNFCKIDAVNVFNFRRIVVSIDLKESSDFK